MADVVKIVQKVADIYVEGVCGFSKTPTGITIYPRGPQNQLYTQLPVKVSANSSGLSIAASWRSFPQVKIDWNKNPEVAVEKALDNIMGIVYEEAVKRKLDIYKF